MAEPADAPLQRLARRIQPALPWLARLFKVVVALLVVWFITAAARRGIADLKAGSWTLQPGWLALGSLLYFVGMLPSAIFWHRILRALGQRPTFWESLRAFQVGHLGKYVPGKAMVVIIRSTLVKSSRVNAAVAAASVFLETLTMMAVGAGLAGGILLVLFPGEKKIILCALLLFLASGLPTLPPVYRRIVAFALRKWKPESLRLDGVSFSLMASGWLSVALGWSVLGVSLWATLRGLGAEELGFAETMPMLTASVAMAVVAGFLSLIPGGAGVRELVLTKVLAPAVGEGIALAAAILLRLLWLASDLVFSALLYFPGKSRDRSADRAATQNSVRETI